MPAKVLTTGTTQSDAAVDAAVVTLPPVPDNVLHLLRHLQSQVTALSARVTALENA